MIRFLLCPGRVTSRNDGQVHYVSSQDLARLYGVNPAECDVSRQAMSADHGLIELHPRSDGDYSLDGDLWYSDRALAKQAALDVSQDMTRWTDLMGLLQPRTEAPPWHRCTECSGDARDRAGGRVVGGKLLCELHAGRAEWPEPTVASIQEMLDRAERNVVAHRVEPLQRQTPPPHPILDSLHDEGL